MALQTDRSAKLQAVRQRVSVITLGVRGYSSVFVDPDGHPWEIAHNPHSTLTPDGGVTLR